MKKKSKKKTKNGRQRRRKRRTEDKGEDDKEALETFLCQASDACARTNFLFDLLWEAPVESLAFDAVTWRTHLVNRLHQHLVLSLCRGPLTNFSATLLLQR